jgi:hypothetical protein
MIESARTARPSGRAPRGAVNENARRDATPTQLEEICDVYDEVGSLLQHADRASNDAAIACLSQHLAAFERVWRPEIERQLPAETRTLQEHDRGSSRLWRRLRLLQRCLGGDARVVLLDPASLRQQIRRSAESLAVIERRLLRSLQPTLADEQRRHLLDRWDRALAHAPTRPHPHLAHRGRLGPFAFTVVGWSDRVLDALDARPIPARRRPHSTGAAGDTVPAANGVPQQRSDSDMTAAAA